MPSHSRIILDGTDQHDRMRLVALQAEERLGQVYRFEIGLLSPDAELSPKELLGKRIGAELALQEGATRRFNGVVTRIRRGRHQGKLHEYRLDVEPDFALLSRRSDARVFQNKKVVEVFGEVVARLPSMEWHFRENGGTRLPWEHCVQYQESDLAFCMRLLEQEGIYFCFEHQQAGRTMMHLLDSNAACQERSRPVTVLAYNPSAAAALRSHLYVAQWSKASRLVSGRAELTDFDFAKPMQGQDYPSSQRGGHAGDDLDLYFYPGEFDSPDEGQQYARLRMEEQRARHAVLEGETSSPAVEIGKIVQVKGHPATEMNGDFLVVATSYAYTHQQGESGAGLGASLQCRFEAIPAGVPFRPPRITPKSRITGPQTAFVVGPEQNEIHTDAYGRIRVMFHWDRYGKPGEDTSCWIRAAQPWANQGFGFWALPRVGSEVVVQFLDGDPDRPLVVGSVYNGENRIPYPQPANKTCSGLRTFSTPGGGVDDYNELRFEDRKGDEEIYLQAQKNLNVRIKADATRTVGNDDSLSVERKQNLQIGEDRHLSVKGKQITAIDAEHHVSVGADQLAMVEGKRAAKVGGNDSADVGGDALLKTGGMVGVSCGQSYALKAQLGIALSAQTGIDLKSGTAAVIDAAAGITLKCGSSFISLTPAGIFIQGATLMLNSGGAPLQAQAANPGTPAALQKQAEAGEIAIAASPPVRPATLKPKAGALADAARTGAPFVSASAAFNDSGAAPVPSSAA